MRPLALAGALAASMAFVVGCGGSSGSGSASTTMPAERFRELSTAAFAASSVFAGTLGSATPGGLPAIAAELERERRGFDRSLAQVRGGDLPHSGRTARTPLIEALGRVDASMSRLVVLARNGSRRGFAGEALAYRDAVSQAAAAARNLASG